MAKHTRRRGGTWYDPRTWFSSTPTAVEETSEAVPSTGMSSTPSTPMSSPSPYGGRKGKKSRRNKRRGTKSRRKH